MRESGITKRSDYELWWMMQSCSRGLEALVTGNGRCEEKKSKDGS